MEENNKFESNTGNSGSGSLLYGAEPQAQTEESGHSSVYGPASQTQAESTAQPVQLAKPSESVSEPQGMTPVQLTKPSEPVEPVAQPQGMAPVQLTKPSEPVAQTQGMEPVQLVKPSEPVSQPQSTVSVQLTKPSEPVPQIQMVPPQQGQYYQPMNGNQPNNNVPPMNGFQPNNNVPPMNRFQPNNNVPPMNGNQPNYNVPPMNGFQPNNNVPPMNGFQPNNNVPPMNGNQPNYNIPPMNGGQPNPMGFGPMQGASSVQGAPVQKKKKTGLVVGILCAAAVAIVIVVGALVAKSLFGGSSAEQQLAKGFANMATEMAAYQSSISEDIGLVELTQLKYTDPIHTNIKLSITDPNGTTDITNFDVGFDMVSNYEEKKAEFDVSFGVYGFSMNVGNVIAADNTLYVSAPMVFQNEVYSLELTNLGRDFNNSAWSELIGETIPEDYSLTLFEDVEMPDHSGESQSWIMDIFNRPSGLDDDSVKCETIKQKKEFTLNGTTAECSGVRVTVDKDACNEGLEATKREFLASDAYINAMQEYESMYGDDFDEYQENMEYLVDVLFGVRYEQDFVVDFYFDKKGRIINISTPEDIAVSNAYAEVAIDSIAIDIDLTGAERTLDSIEGGMYMQIEDEIIYLGISRTADITEDYYNEDFTLRLQDNTSDEELTFCYTNEWGYKDHTFDLQMSIEVPDTSLVLSADGYFTDIVKGESYTLRLDHSALTIDGEDLLLMSGSVTTEPADSTIEVPGNATNVLKMSESEIESLIMDLLYNSGTMY